MPRARPQPHSSLSFKTRASAKRGQGGPGDSRRLTARGLSFSEAVRGLLSVFLEREPWGQLKEETEDDAVAAK